MKLRAKPSSPPEPSIDKKTGTAAPAPAGSPKVAGAAAAPQGPREGSDADGLDVGLVAAVYKPVDLWFYSAVPDQPRDAGPAPAQGDAAVIDWDGISVNQGAGHAEANRFAAKGVLSDGDSTVRAGVTLG